MERNFLTLQDHGDQTSGPSSYGPDRTLTADTGVSATRFGRRVVGDPRFVVDLRAGRRPRERTVAKIQAYFSDEVSGEGI
jgi:hypothetical protein